MPALRRASYRREKAMIKLLLVENQPAIRFGLRMWLRLAPDLTIVGEAGDGLAALSQAALVRPDVILLGIENDSGGIDSIRLIKALGSAAPGSAIVILSLHDDAITRRRLLLAGAAAFVSKHDSGERVLQAIRQAGSTDLSKASTFDAQTIRNSI
jgi:DNA-binding NarL/FixJ family response regulator